MEKIKEKYNIIHRWLIVSLVLSFCLFIFLPSLYPSVICLLAILTCAGFVLKSLLSLNCLLHSKLPIKTFLLGSFIAVGGSTFDIVNTIIQTPDLSFEANPIARLFLDNQFSLLFVYIIGALGQTLVVLFTLLLWMIFLKTYPLLLSELQNKPPRSLICTLLGGPKASYVDLLVGKIEPIYAITAVAPLLIGSFLYRWYLGLEWLELVPISRVVAPSLAVCFSLVCYLYFMRKKLAHSISEANLTPLSIAGEDGR
tara:strand:- start:130517 stop:131281 length:765 start_codon:yes stop_codon:yes gene_type:complete